MDVEVSTNEEDVFLEKKKKKSLVFKCRLLRNLLFILTAINILIGVINNVINIIYHSFYPI